MHVLTAQVCLVHRDQCVEMTPHDRLDDIFYPLLLLGRLPKVNLTLLEGGKCPSVRTSVRPSTKSFFDLNEIWYVGRGR